MVQWLRFFLTGVLETAEKSIGIFNSIIKLRKDIEEIKIRTLGKRLPVAIRFFRYLYSKPIVDAPEVAKILEVNISTAYRLIRDSKSQGYSENKPASKETAFSFLSSIWICSND